MAAIDAAPPLLEMRGISKRFGPTVALDGVSFSVRAGQVHALVGENGAGKSTLMKVLSGAERADSGTMRLDGSPFTPSDPLHARRLGVAMIYQELSLADHLTVEANISLGMEPTRAGFVRRADARQTAGRALAELGHGEIELDSRVGDISISARQIVELARALATGCRVLVLDEPTSSLSREDVQRLFALVRRLKERGIAIVYISHFLEEVREIADDFTVLRDGVAVGGGDTARSSTDDMVAMMVGRRIEELYPRSPRVPGPPVLTLDGVSGSPMPDGASLELRRGEVLGIAGLVGSGRTELLRAIFGLAPITKGDVKIEAFRGAALPHQRLRQGVGMLSEDRKDEGLARSLSVADNLTLSRLTGLGPAGLVLPSRQADAADRWIGKLGIRCRGSRQSVDSLSGGNQQKVAIARLLHHDVDVLLLDEPTRGIDVASKARIYRLIDELATGDAGRSGRKAILLVSSYLPELLGVCDRIAVMCRGRLGRARPVTEWNKQELMLEATGQAA